MARPLRIEYPGAFYHVTSRGNEQKDIFKSRNDREQFCSYLKSSAERYGANVHAYCLMSNHYHLLLETPEGNLSQIMRHINGAYTTYFNSKRKRAGHLFQGRYKAILIEADEYAAELSRYLHLNPVKAGMVAKPQEYEWSSYRYYLGQTATPAWLRTDFVLSYFGGMAGMENYREFVNEFPVDDSESPLTKTVAATVLGSAEFVRRIAGDHLAENPADRNVPAVRKLTHPTLEEIIITVEKLIADDNSLSRKVSIFFCHRYSGARLREVGERFGMSDAAITQASKRIRVAVEREGNLRARLGRVAKELRIVLS